MSSAKPLKPTDLAFALVNAAQVVSQVVRHGRSLDQALVKGLVGIEHPAARGAIADLSYFALRWRGRGLALTRLLTGKKQLKPLFLEDYLALCFSLIWDESSAKYEAHTVVNQAVTGCANLNSLARAKGLVNACLRSFLREPDQWIKQSSDSLEAVWNFPKWWVEKIRNQHPESWQLMLEQANAHPPMVLRVNARCATGARYVEALQQANIQAELMAGQTVYLPKPMPVTQLPGFDLGMVSVQDSAAQLAAPLLDPQDGQRILDACAAPGGKTGHLLELAQLDVLALDSSTSRLVKVQENYERLKPTLPNGHQLTLKSKPAEEVDFWWDGQPFDAILADLPCSGSGVVRRHPDIRWLRRESDIQALSQKQYTILDSLWSTLKPGGKLLLVTCSIFLEEGPSLLSAFLERHPDAQALPAPGHVLPQVVHESVKQDDRFNLSPDGFYYALVHKSGSS